MEVRPGYKQTEAGVIPADWNAIPIGRFCTCYSGGTPSTSNPRYYGGNIAWITSSDLNIGRITEVRGRITEEGLANSATKLVNKGTLLLALYGATAGVCAITEIQAAINQAVLAIVTRDCAKDFLFHFLTFRKDQYIKTYTQGGQPNFSGELVKSFVVFLPPFSEQQAIATALSDVDALLDGLDRLIAKKRDLKQAAMQQLLTGQTRLPGFHGEWEVKRLDQFAPLQRGFDLPTSQIQRGAYPVVYSNGVQNHHAKFMVKAPGVVTGRSGTIGNVHFVTVDFWPHNTALWVTDFKRNDPKFVFYFLTSVGLERFGTGSGVPTLNRNDVHEFRVRVPSSSAEQTAIAAVLSDMDAELAALEARRDKTRDLKQAMMQELLTGKTRLVPPGGSHD